MKDKLNHGFQNLVRLGSLILLGPIMIGMFLLFAIMFPLRKSFWNRSPKFNWGWKAIEFQFKYLKEDL